MEEIEKDLWYATKYMIFRLWTLKPKTTVWHVYNRGNGCLIAKIEWYSAWRQYVFLPEAGSLFNNGCLSDIIEFLDHLNAEQKKKCEERKEIQDEVQQ